MGTLWFVALGFAAGPLAARFAAVRAAAQPVSCSVSDEETVLSVAADRPHLIRLAWAAGMRSDMFTSADRSATFEQLTGAAGDLDQFDEDSAACYTPVDDIEQQFITAGERVMSDAWDRTAFPAALAVVGSDGPKPLRFEFRQPTWKRQLFASVWLAMSFAASVAFTDRWTVSAALLAVSVYGFVTASVDHDTLMVDVQLSLVTLSCAWALLIVGTQIGQVTVQDVLVASGVSAMWVLMFRLLNMAYVKVRGVQGIGVGDSVILLSTIGVPAAAFGSVTLGVWSMVAATVAAVVFIGLKAVTVGHGKMQPFALGPFLSVGWLIALPVLSGWGML